MGRIPFNYVTNSVNWLSRRIPFSPDKNVQTRCLGSLTKVPAKLFRCTSWSGANLTQNVKGHHRSLSDQKDPQPPSEKDRPYSDGWGFLKSDLSRSGATGDYVDQQVPIDPDILVIGGGVTGLFTAYWLKHFTSEACNVVVLERDPTYTRASTVLSVGGIRQQFSLPQNIQMSLFGAEFLRNIKEHLSVLDLDPPDVQFTPNGYLFLASGAGSETLTANHSVQEEQGALVALMDKDSLRKRFPWLNVEDIELGSYGLQNEGVFDPWLLLAALKAKCLSQGVTFITGELVDFELSDTRTNKRTNKVELICAKVKSKPDGKIYEVKPMYFVNCAGPWAQEVGKMAGIGGGEGPLQVPIPVEPRKRYVFLFHCPDGPGLDTPMIIDPSGVYLRREGMAGHYICGVSPIDDSEEPETATLDVDYGLFQEKIWPILANRVPACEKLKLDYEDKEMDPYSVDPGFFKEAVLPVLQSRIPAFERAQLKSAWAGYYDYNTHDQNLIIGNHPVYKNFLMACGSSGHGLQHSMAVGRAMGELLIKGRFVTIDLSDFHFDRVLYGEKMYERNIV